MRTYKLALIGFGNVGQGFAQILRDQADLLAENFGLEYRIVAVCDMLKGSIYHPDGFDPAMLLDTVEAGKNLETLEAKASGWDAGQTIEGSGADALVELSYTDLETGQPATGHIRRALEAGMHAVTTNKGPIALHFPELHKLAQERNLQIGIEGTVMSGTPAMHLGLDLLAAADVQKVQGILNGTTNYMLTQMEQGATYEEVLADAQEKGYAEADPTGDVEGFDAAGKVVILANVLMGASISMQDIDRTGITGLTPDDIEAARAEAKRWKLVAGVERTTGGIKASVQPVKLPLDHPLASVGGPTNAVSFTTALLGDVTLIGPGAGRLATGYAILCDLLAIDRAS